MAHPAVVIPVAIAIIPSVVTTPVGAMTIVALRAKPAVEQVSAATAHAAIAMVVASTAVIPESHAAAAERTVASIRLGRSVVMRKYDAIALTCVVLTTIALINPKRITGAAGTRILIITEKQISVVWMHISSTKLIRMVMEALIAATFRRPTTLN
jgi:hypothetical protein